MTCIKQEFCIHEKYCQRHIGQNFDSCILFSRNSKPMTNEEWLRSCPPQELMRFLMNVAYGGHIRNVQKRTFDEEAEKWSKWLKEKHTE